MIVPDYQLSLAIGKEGQNARLAARLTGWRIDIRPDTEQSGAGAGRRDAADGRGGRPHADGPDAFRPGGEDACGAVDFSGVWPDARSRALP